MDILEKYNRLRPSLQHGDLMLFHGKGVMATIIQNCDKSYWNHIGVVIEINGAFFIVDSNASGVQADRLSWRIRKYKDGDFAIIKPTCSKALLNEHLSKLLRRSDIKWVKYDFWNGGKELLNRKFGWNLKVGKDSERDICSDYVSEYALALNMVNKKAFEKLRVAFPEDYERFLKFDGAIFIKE